MSFKACIESLLQSLTLEDMLEYYYLPRSGRNQFKLKFQDDHPVFDLNKQKTMMIIEEPGKKRQIITIHTLFHRELLDEMMQPFVEHIPISIVTSRLSNDQFKCAVEFHQDFFKQTKSLKRLLDCLIDETLSLHGNKEYGNHQVEYCSCCRNKCKTES